MQAAGLAIEEQPFWRDCPDIPEELEWVIGAFWTLASSRTFSGLGVPGPISFDSIDRYATRFEVDDFEAFHAMIRAMDAAYLEGLKDG